MAQIFTRLLLATEHTEYDSGAEAVALAMAQRCKLPLATVMTLVSNPEYEALAPQIAARAEAAAAVSIAQVRELASAFGVHIDLHLRRGENPYQEIVEEARLQRSELIIIRRRGKRGFLANLLVGEMVSKVVAHAPCHVLIVPRGGQMWTQRVLVAAEPGTQGLHLVDCAAAVAAECGLPLSVVCVVASDALRQSALDFVAHAVRQAKERDVQAQAEVCVGKPFSEILASATRAGADLLVMGSRSDGRIGRALVGGVAQKVIGLSDVPVLVLQFEETQGKPPP